ncbi:MAG: hypothetical protein N3E41_08945 [Thermofilaceae archaeon]|nr:hypothetical protein [Thermofilaceae archaeon]
MLSAYDGGDGCGVRQSFNSFPVASTMKVLHPSLVILSLSILSQLHRCVLRHRLPLFNQPFQFFPSCIRYSPTV